jgi:hypothetical protein
MTNEQIKLALESADWSGASIGNKALIKAAIAALSSPAKVGGDERDAITRAKGILDLVDDYHERPSQATRTKLRIELTDEFSELLAYAALSADGNAQPEHTAIYLSKRLVGHDGEASFIQAHINQAVSEAVEALSADGGNTIMQNKVAFLRQHGAVDAGTMLRDGNLITLVTNQGRVERFDANEFGGIQLLADGGEDKRDAVAYLDLGAGGYMDIGTELTDEQLAALPKGRHMLGIIGTYGVDGYHRASPSMYDGKDAERLQFAMHNWGPREFAMHVLRRGGNGDLSDCRSFVDAIAAKAKGDA